MATKKAAKSTKKTAAKKPSSTRKYSPSASEDVEREMKAMKQGKLTSGRSGKKVTNPKQAIAIGLSEARKVPVLNCLYRYRETVSQTKLERAARWENMSGAFRMKRGFDVRGRNLLVIDDVFTTGATVNACAQALAQAGAGQLAVLTVARS